MGVKSNSIAVATTAVGMTVSLLWSRGAFERLSLFESVEVVVVGCLGGAAYFTGIHYLLKGWDRLLALRQRSRQP